MEGISVNVYKGLRGCWTRRSYQRLNGSSIKQNTQVQLAYLGTPPTNSSTRPRRRRRRGRFWRSIKINPRVRIRFGSPKKWLKKLRDVYVKMMLSFANSGVFSGGFGGAVEYGYAGYAGGFGRPIKEYDEKMIVEIYKSLMMSQGQLVVGHGEPAAAAARKMDYAITNSSSSQIACGR